MFVYFCHTTYFRGNEFPLDNYKSREQKQYIWLLFPAFLFLAIVKDL